MKLYLEIFAIVAIAGVLFSFVVDRVIIPWMAQHTVKKILSEIKNGKPERPRVYESEIKYDSTGIQIISLKQPQKNSNLVKWLEIKRVTAFKRDLYTVDCICLLFESVDQPALEINEEMKEWPSLLDQLPKLLPGCKSLPEWVTSVGTPAFATNTTEIFVKAG